MFDSIFFTLSFPSIKELLSLNEFISLYEVVDKYNYIYCPNDPVYGEFITKELYTEDLTILVLLALRHIKFVKNSNGSKKITEQHISNAIKDMRNIWDRLCYSSYHFSQTADLENFDDIDHRTIYVSEAETIFRNILFAIGEFKNTTTNIQYFDTTKKNCKAKSTPLNNAERQSLKKCINNLLSENSPLDYLPIDILKVLDKEFYKLKYKDFKQSKGIVSWYNIINQIKNTDNLLVVKDFVDRAIKSTINDKDNRNDIIEYLDSKVEEIKKPKKTSHSTTNIYNAPVGQVANNIEYQEFNK